MLRFSVVDIANNRDIIFLRALIEEGADINEINKDGNTALICAARHGFEEVLACLIELGAEINFISRSSVTALYAAAKSGHLDCVKALLAVGAKTHISRHKNPLDVAVARNYVDMVRELMMSETVSIKKLGMIQSSVLIAAQHGDLDMVKLLMANSSDININLAGMTPLLTAVQFKRVAVVDFLLKAGVDVNHCWQGKSALHLAVGIGDLEITSLLLEYGADIYYINDQGINALYLAVHWGHQAIVTLLLENGASLVSKLRQSLMRCAVERGHLGIIKMLFSDFRVSLQEIEPLEGDTLLHLAARFGHIEIVEYLIKQQLDINAQNYRGETPLCVAAINNASALNTLVEAGACLDTCTHEGDRPVDLAYQTNNTASIRLFKQLDQYAESARVVAQDSKNPMSRFSQIPVDILTLILPYLMYTPTDQIARTWYLLRTIPTIIEMPSEFDYSDNDSHIQFRLT